MCAYLCDAVCLCKGERLELRKMTFKNARRARHKSLCYAKKCNAMRE